MKLTSRKFWISIAGMLSGIGAGIAGIATDNDVIAVVGVICTVLSGGIYTMCEAMIDIEAVPTGEEYEEYNEEEMEE